MAYTPELNQQESGNLRRIAWALGLPMTKTMSRVLEHATSQVNKTMICDACKDKTFCSQCFVRR